MDNSLNESGGITVLKGNIAPYGCIIKHSAAEARLLQHKGKALVYEHIKDLKADIDRADLDVDENTILVLKNAGPVGAPGMPEWGQLPIPKKLLKQGVRDLLRISDARMSGTSYGACILHISPEAYIGGPFGLVQTGDIVEVDIEKRSINLLVDDQELLKRSKKPPAYRRKEYTSGYAKLYIEHVSQAHEGCDFDFLSSETRDFEPDIF